MPSTSCAGSLVGDYMICDARLFREWRDWAFPRMSRTRSSTIKQARFLEWPRYIRGTISSLNEKKRWIGGVLTLSGLSERLISQGTRHFQSRLQRKMIRQVTNAIQNHLRFDFWIATSAL